MAKEKTNMAESERKWIQILKKAARDEIFRQKLLNHPEQVLRENGIEIPAGVKFKIHENTPTTRHLVLPEMHIAQNLSEEDLRKVAGGGGAMFMLDSSKGRFDSREGMILR